MKTKKNNKLKKVSIVFSVLLVAGLSFAFFQQNPPPLWAGMPSGYTIHTPSPGQYPLWSIFKGPGLDANLPGDDYLLDPKDAGTLSRWHYLETIPVSSYPYICSYISQPQLGGYELLRGGTDDISGLPFMRVETWQAPLAGTPNRVPLLHYGTYDDRGPVRINWDPAGYGYSGGTPSLISNVGIRDNSNWYYCGVAGYICTKPTTYNGVSYTTPLYRMKKTVTAKLSSSNSDVRTYYLYTTDNTEGTSKGWVYETRLGYVGPSIYKNPLSISLITAFYDPLYPCFTTTTYPPPSLPSANAVGNVCIPTVMINYVTEGDISQTGYLSRYYEYVPNLESTHFVLQSRTPSYVIPRTNVLGQDRTANVDFIQTWRAPIPGTPNYSILYWYQKSVPDNNRSLIPYNLITNEECELGVNPNYISATGQLLLGGKLLNTDWFFIGTCGAVCSTPTLYNGINYNIPLYRKYRPSTQKYLYTTSYNEGASEGWVYSATLGYVAAYP